MRVLIVHDRADVAAKIRKIAINSGAAEDRVSVVTDGTSARRELSRQMFDILVIDLTLPHISGRDAPSYTVADQLLNELFLLEDLKTPADIIAITKDREAFGRVNSDVGANVMAIISEDSDGTWERKLAEKISYTRKVASARQALTNSQYEFDCVVITALDEELQPFKDVFEFSEYEQFDGVFTFMFGDKDGSSRRGAAFSVGRSGEARAAAATQVLLALFRPRLILMSGICGGVKGKVDLGDVVVAESAIDWDYGKWSEPLVGEGEAPAAPQFFSRPNPVSVEGSRAHRMVREMIESGFIDEKVVREAVSGKSFGLITSPKIHLAPMASGSSVIASDSIQNAVRDLNESIRGIDMECFGMYYAVSNTHVIRPEFICIKCVSDYSNGTKNDDHHEGAAFLSALVSIEVMQSRWDFRR